eukprot:scaffold29910_cov53-Phaeocystis_antarctica.AAC.2
MTTGACPPAFLSPPVSRPAAAPASASAPRRGARGGRRPGCAHGAQGWLAPRPSPDHPWPNSPLGVRRPRSRGGRRTACTVCLLGLALSAAQTRTRSRSQGNETWHPWWCPICWHADRRTGASSRPYPLRSGEPMGR